MDITTIKLTNATKKRLENLKIHRKESYEEVIKRILSVLNVCKVHPNDARHMLEEFNRAKETTNSIITPPSVPQKTVKSS